MADVIGFAVLSTYLLLQFMQYVTIECVWMAHKSIWPSLGYDDQENQIIFSVILPESLK